MTTGYGETHPALVDDRMPVMLVVLDGLGDRALPALGGQTPAEAADTPVLDRLTRRGGSGWHVPFGWGPAPSSEVAHWAMFGYGEVAFPGRAVLEGLGAGLDVACGVATLYAALRCSAVRDGRLWITGRAAPDDGEDAAGLFAELAPLLAEHGADLHPFARGEALLRFPRFANGNVTDSDPFFEQFHPWLRVQSLDAEAALAAAVNAFLQAARAGLAGSALNRARVARGRPALDVLTTKWAGARQPVASFAEQAGVAGAAVTGGRMYRGLARLLGMTTRDVAAQPDLGADIASRIDAGVDLLDAGARFVHVHTKTPDEAGHTKDPHAKRRVLEALDPGLARLEAIADRAIVAITGDHATPSSGGVLHTADPTPLLLLGPTVRPDAVTRFGERHARDGWFGVVHARELLTLLFSHANRPIFLGHRATSRRTLALPDDPVPMPLS